MALEAAPLKPILYKRYVDDTFLIRPHSRHAFNNFVNFLNGLYKNIQFPVEIEQEGKWNTRMVSVQETNTHQPVLK